THGVAHADIQVEDIMTPASKLEAIPLQEVAQMRVGHIVATLKAVHRQHLMAAEDGGRRIRGLFSASQVARQLGMELQTFAVAQSFADIEAALVRQRPSPWSRDEPATDDRPLSRSLRSVPLERSGA